MLFYSSHRKLRLILESADVKWSALGHPIHTGGLTINFENGQFSTSDQALIDRLKGLKSFGIDFYCSENTGLSEDIRRKLDAGAIKVSSGTKGTAEAANKRK